MQTTKNKKEKRGAIVFDSLSGVCQPMWWWDAEGRAAPIMPAFSPTRLNDSRVSAKKLLFHHFRFKDKTDDTFIEIFSLSLIACGWISAKRLQPTFACAF